LIWELGCPVVFCGKGFRIVKVLVSEDVPSLPYPLRTRSGNAKKERKNKQLYALTTIGIVSSGVQSVHYQKLGASRAKKINNYFFFWCLFPSK